MILLIAYRLTIGRDYSAFFEALKGSPAASWWHYIDNVWLLKTNESPEQLNARIEPYINQGHDTILITKVDASDYKAWMPREAHDWIRQNSRSST